MARLPVPEASKEDYDRAVAQATHLGLFSPGGSFERFPGAVLLAGQNGLVLGASLAAEPIAAQLKDGRCAELRAAIDSALNGHAAQVNPLVLAPEDHAKGVGLAFDVAVLPWGDGTAALLLGRDITLERGLRSALIESRQRYKDLLEAACDFAWETDAEGCFTFISPQGALGYTAAELVGRAASSLHVDHVEEQDTPFSAHAPIKDVEVWLRGADEEPACVLATALPLSGSNGRWCGTRGLCRNITDARSHQAELASDRHRERLLAYVLGIVRDEIEPSRVMTAAASALVPALPAAGVCIYRQEHSGELACAAQAGELPPKDLLETALWRAAMDSSQEAFEQNAEQAALFALATRVEGQHNGVLCVWRRGPAESWTEADRHLLGEIAAQVGLAGQQLARQQELEQLSSTDPLTGLLNRRSFMAEMQTRYAQHSDRRSGAALFFVDLDNFKAVNDRRGHQQGDLALTTLARILREQTRGRDLVARLGGDEFAFFIDDITPAAAENKASELLRAGQELAVYSGGSDVPLGLSIGIAACDPAGREPLNQLIERADQAMYCVKRGGKGGMQLSHMQKTGAA